MMSRRLFALAVVLMMAVGSVASAEPRFDGVTLRVATYGGNWRAIMERALGQRFAALGGRLEIVAGSPPANFAKLLASRGRPPFDIMDIADNQVPAFQDSDYLATLDPARLPALAQLRPGSFTGKLVSAWTSHGVICCHYEIYAALGLPVPSRYADLAVPALAGKVMIPDLNSGGGVVNIGAMAVVQGGSETDIQPGLDLIARMKGVRLWTQGDQVVLAFQSGDILAAVSNSGWCLNARKAGVPVRSAAPAIRPGVAGVENHGWLGVMKSTTQRDAAYWFLNACLSRITSWPMRLAAGRCRTICGRWRNSAVTRCCRR